MTGREILKAARPHSPCLQFRDVWHLTQEFQKEGLLACLNPDEQTGRLYCWTDLGRESIGIAFGLAVEPAPEDVDWKLYGRIARAKARRSVLQELRQPRWDGKEALTATDIRKSLLKKQPLALNPTIRALQHLCAEGLAEIIGTTKKRRQKLYRLTNSGERIVEQMGR